MCSFSVLKQHTKYKITQNIVMDNCGSNGKWWFCDGNEAELIQGTRDGRSGWGEVKMANNITDHDL